MFIIHSFQLRMSGVYIIELPSGLVLIDAGSPGDEKKLLAHLGAFINKPLHLIYITHAHLDHVGAAASIRRVANAPVAIHANDAVALASGETHLGKVRGRGRITATLMPLVNWLLPVKPVAADILLQDGQLLQEFGIPGYVLHTPGHTPGSTSLIVDGRVAFVGDLLSTNARPHIQHLYASDWGEINRSLRRLEALDLEWLYPGHGRRPLSGEDFTSLMAKHQQT
jgi:glyoxylase-like metal-dependent hydrolase (beta-lactamase superfamily II)